MPHSEKESQEKAEHTLPGVLVSAEEEAMLLAMLLLRLSSGCTQSSR